MASQTGIYCDHGHVVYKGTVRILPLNHDGSANLHVCMAHYHAELRARKRSGSWDTADSRNYPAWELLKVYNPDE